MWGWLYGVDSETIPQEYQLLPCSKDKAIIALYQELKETYIQREITVIKNLISYLSAESGKTSEMN
ncbi:hypothetical protein JOC73_002185 [Alkaliphilus hydrothermalis]|uniref:Uncharacterized protein n=1 Tax=Alkaliphilus hydrothermalis TaxID=1482730 RepID=A0ABS2NRV8_9FIRM|nr:hypothetical protein [Alkaliphilus hydrothermalis]